MLKTQVLYVWLPAIMIGLNACTSALVEPLAAPQAFPIASYCEAPKSEGSLKVSESLLAVVKNEDGNSTDDEVADALLEKAALEIAHASPDNAACLDAFARGEAMFRKALATHQNRLAKAGGYKSVSDPAFGTVQKEITRMWREDQSARGAYIELGTEDTAGADFWAQRLSAAHATRIDGQSTHYIESLLDTYDWIDMDRFGSSVSAHAWILIQHADDRPDLQARVLERMEPYLENGGIRPSNYAFLWDRVAVNTGREQRYGTQPTWECTDGELELQPLEEPATVNERRAALGMDTVEEGLADMARNVCR